MIDRLEENIKLFVTLFTLLSGIGLTSGIFVKNVFSRKTVIFKSPNSGVFYHSIIGAFPKMEIGA